MALARLETLGDQAEVALKIAEPHVRGIVSMARKGDPDTANSQFFIVFDDARFLDNQYTVWGEVESGMEYVDALPAGEPPSQPGRIVSAKVS